jgi:hypothetical protein
VRQAIQTKWLGPTNTRGSRVKAWCQAKSITLSWDHALNADRNHAVAAQTLARKLGWNGVWSGGALPDSGYAFVQASECDFAI